MSDEPGYQYGMPYGYSDPENVPLPPKPADGYLEQPDDVKVYGYLEPSNVPPTQPDTARDWNIITDIAERLRLTQQFDDIILTGPPDVWGFSAGARRAVYLEPNEWEEDLAADNPESLYNIITVKFKMTIAVRITDPIARDNEVDRLLSVAKNTINGQKLRDGYVFPDKSRLSKGKWLPAAAPERRMEVVGTFAYDIDGSDQHDEEV